ncbi:MDR family MFS transporter [Pararhizobium mangrovi]|uniref:MFS transporter n=1 Tax=Pararhizobium mangrovi TaxID=2590452 RepID=A0A506U9R7_9HYPH|nr:MDR family MFS transporter [Pararhizobium mangrovi]TPW29329.1 MFS transporter [Pararhizobium mangrovi]
MDKKAETTERFEAPPVSHREQNVIIGGVLLAMLLAALDQTIVAPALPTIGAALGHADYLPWVVTAYLLMATAMAPLYGKISDLYGRRRTIFGAIFVFLVGSVVSALAPNMLVLILGRACQGLGGGGLFTLSQTVIADLVPPRERAKYAAWISGTWAVASIAGPLLGGYFAEHLHWSLIFWINLPLGAAAVLVLSEPLKKIGVASREHKLDLVGAGLLVVATSLLLLALNWGGETFSWGSIEVIGAFVLAVVFFALFGWRVTSAREPLVSLEILRNAIVLTATTSMFLAQAAAIGTSVYLPIYLQHHVGLSVSESGTALLGLLLGTVGGATISGRLVARITHYRRIAVFGALLSIFGYVVFAWQAETAPLWLIEVLAVFTGAGTGMTFPIATISVQNAVTKAHLGVATGVLTFLRSLGGALGVAVLGAVALSFGLPLASEGTRNAVRTSVDTARPFAAMFFVAAIIMVLALVAILSMTEKPLMGREERDAE